MTFGARPGGHFGARQRVTSSRAVPESLSCRQARSAIAGVSSAVTCGRSGASSCSFFVSFGAAAAGASIGASSISLDWGGGAGGSSARAAAASSGLTSNVGFGPTRASGSGRDFGAGWGGASGGGASEPAVSARLCRAAESAPINRTVCARSPPSGVSTSARKPLPIWDPAPAASTRLAGETFVVGGAIRGDQPIWGQSAEIRSISNPLKVLLPDESAPRILLKGEQSKIFLEPVEGMRGATCRPALVYGG